MVHFKDAQRVRRLYVTEQVVAVARANLYNVSPLNVREKRRVHSLWAALGRPVHRAWYKD
jgi:hypothetical protein